MIANNSDPTGQKSLDCDSDSNVCDCVKNAVLSAGPVSKKSSSIKFTSTFATSCVNTLILAFHVKDASLYHNASGWSIGPLSDWEKHASSGQMCQNYLVPAPVPITCTWTTVQKRAKGSGTWQVKWDLWASIYDPASTQPYASGDFEEDTNYVNV